MKIRTALILTTVLLSLLIIGLSGASLHKAWREHDTSKQVITANTLGDDLIDAIRLIGQERGTTIMALTSPPSQTHYNKLQQLRKSVNTYVKRILPLSNALHMGLNDPQSKALLEQGLTTLKDSKERLSILRISIDEEISKPISAREIDFDKTVFKSFNARIQTLADYNTTLARAIDHLDERILRYLNIKQATATVIDYLGRERDLFASLINKGEKAPQEIITKLYKSQGIIENTWKSINTLTNVPYVDANVKSQYHLTHQKNFRNSNTLRKKVYAAAPTEVYPVSSDFWFHERTTAIDQFDQFSDTVSKEAKATAIATTDTAETDLITHFFILGFCLFLALISIRIINRKVIYRLSALKHHMDEIAAGKTSFKLTIQGHDEVSDMMQSLEQLRKNSAEAFESKQMLEDLHISAFTCDPFDDFKIKYINKEMYKVLKTIKNDTGINPEAVLGKPIDVLHKDAQPLRRILSDPSQLPYNARMTVGNQVIILKATPVYNNDGQYKYAMLNWDIITEFSQMSDDFEANVMSVVDMVSSAAVEMQATSKTMAATAEETRRQSNSAAERAIQTSNNVNSVASATEQLSASVSEITQQVSYSTKMTGQAFENAQETNHKVQSLADAAQKIGDIIDLINDIAGQTNLLALNATIEAARAGEAGKGFAVVASEVKNLANETAKATESVTAQINSIQSSTAESVKAIDGICKVIDELNQTSTKIAVAVEQQRGAAREIADNVGRAALATKEMSANIGEVSLASVETGQSSEQVLDASAELARQSEHLRCEVNKFLEKARSI